MIVCTLLKKANRVIKTNRTFVGFRRSDQKAPLADQTANGAFLDVATKNGPSHAPKVTAFGSPMFCVQKFRLESNNGRELHTSAVVAFLFRIYDRRIDSRGSVLKDPPSRVIGKLKPCIPGRCPPCGFTAPNIRECPRQVNRETYAGGLQTTVEFRLLYSDVGSYHRLSRTRQEFDPSAVKTRHYSAS